MAVSLLRRRRRSARSSASDLSCWTKIILRGAIGARVCTAASHPLFSPCEDSRLGGLGSVGDTRLTCLGTIRTPWHCLALAASWPLTPLQIAQLAPLSSREHNPKPPRHAPPLPASPPVLPSLTSPPSPWPGLVWLVWCFCDPSFDRCFRCFGRAWALHPHTHHPIRNPGPCTEDIHLKNCRYCMAGGCPRIPASATLGTGARKTWWASRGCRRCWGPFAQPVRSTRSFLERRAFG